MKIALCTTTIHVPHSLKLMRKCWADVRFFVAVDEKTPGEVHRFIDEIDAARHFFHGDGNWKCSEAIGFSTLARRNIAFLEALAWGADVIYSWDDDNILLDTEHFWHLETVLGNPFDGVKLHGANNWFDPGTLLRPQTRHRGFPYDKPISKTASSVVGAKIGVAAGLVIGDPDIDASTRIEHKPDIGQVHLFGEVGCVVNQNAWTVFNSQNTAVVRELIPAWFMAPGCGRHDDIFSSLIVQRVMRERGYHVHFGHPFTYQERNTHDLIKDLRAEIDGMSNVSKLATLLDNVVLTGHNVIDDTRVIYNVLANAEWYPKEAVTAALAWLSDCETVL